MTLQKIGCYEILDVIKSGPRPLYKAKAPDGRIVALKTLAVDRVSQTARERFIREGSMCAEFDHPNLVRVFDSGEAGGVLYQVMDLLEGADLATVFAEHRPLTWEQKFSIMEQVCDGLAYAHDRKLIHRDIKPANVFLESSGRLKILDFGMARPDSSQLTQVGSAVGTLNYMAPEQIRAEPCTAACDIFSSGILFYHAATGQHPFSGRGSSVAQIVSAILFNKPDPLQQVAPDAPDGLDFVVNRALEKSPSSRWRSASDLRRALALCRLTIDVPAAPGQSEERKTQEPYVAKTILMPRATAPPKKPPVTPPGSELPPAPAVVKSPAALSPTVREFTYCPSCTARHALDAAVCSHCGVPLTSLPDLPASSPAPLSWGIIAGICAFALLVFLLIVSYASKTR